MTLPVSENAKQVYDNNPADDIRPDDLIYLIRYPYAPNNDMAAKASTFQTYIQMPWISLSSASALLTVNTAYITNRPSLIMLELPVNSSVGDRIKILNIGAGFWQLAQNTGQNIQLGNRVTTTGAGGYIASTAIGDSIELVCVIQNSMWFVEYVIGNISFV